MNLDNKDFYSQLVFQPSWIPHNNIWRLYLDR